jgi:hypothetical protein
VVWKLLSWGSLCAGHERHSFLSLWRQLRVIWSLPSASVLLHLLSTLKIKWYVPPKRQVVSTPRKFTTQVIVGLENIVIRNSTTVQHFYLTPAVEIMGRYHFVIWRQAKSCLFGFYRPLTTFRKDVLLVIMKRNFPENTTVKNQTSNLCPDSKCEPCK